MGFTLDTTHPKILLTLALRTEAVVGPNPRAFTFAGRATHIYKRKVGRLVVTTLRPDPFLGQVFVLLDYQQEGGPLAYARGLRCGQLHREE